MSMILCTDWIAPEQEQQRVADALKISEEERQAAEDARDPVSQAIP